LDAIAALMTGTGIIAVFWDVILAVVVFFAGRKLITFVLKHLDIITERANVEVGIRKFLHSIGKIACYALLVYIIADLVGIPTASLVALIGSVGVTVGLALQGSLSNFASGVLILTLHPFGVGDFISCPQVDGVVESIGLFYTTVITADNKKVTLPNTTLANDPVVNANALDTRRIDLSTGISYDDDVEKAKRVLAEMINSREKVIRKNDTVVFIDSFDSSAITLGIRCWVNTADYWSERWTINSEIKRVLDENKITIPYNKLDINVISEQKN